MTIAKTNSLGVYKEFEIKLSGNEENGHNLTQLIQDFGEEPYQLWSGNISSINAGADPISEVDNSDSLLRVMD